MRPTGAAWWTDMEENCRLNWQLKISNTADNADITQSHARDTRHRRMQEVNGLCTDSGPLRAEYGNVAFHTIQPSSLFLSFLHLLLLCCLWINQIMYYRPIALIHATSSRPIYLVACYYCTNCIDTLEDYCIDILPPKGPKDVFNVTWPL